MAHSKQAAKRTRQNEKRRLHNKGLASSMKTSLKKLMTAIEAKDKEAAAQLLPVACARIDKAAKSNVIHANTAARKKSQVMRAMNGLTAAAS